MERSVRSILDQTLSDLEFLIYDDGSEREDAEVLDKLQGLDRRIRLLRGDGNQGLSHGLNICIRQAKGKYLARMDADDDCLPERLERQVEFLEQHPKFAFAGCGALLFGKEGIWGKRRMKEQPDAKDFLKYSPYIHPSVVFRREVFLNQKGELFRAYDTSQGIGRSEDYELFMRLHREGCFGYNLQEELFLYREDDSGYRKRKFSFRLKECRVRYAGFQKMGIPFPRRLPASIKPLLLGMLPVRLYGWHKQRTASLRGKEDDEAFRFFSNL